MQEGRHTHTRGILFIRVVYTQDPLTVRMRFLKYSKQEIFETTRYIGQPEFNLCQSREVNMEAAGKVDVDAATRTEEIVHCEDLCKQDMLQSEDVEANEAANTSEGEIKSTFNTVDNLMQFLDSIALSHDSEITETSKTPVVCEKPTPQDTGPTSSVEDSPNVSSKTKKWIWDEWNSSDQTTERPRPKRQDSASKQSNEELESIFKSLAGKIKSLCETLHDKKQQVESLQITLKQSKVNHATKLQQLREHWKEKFEKHEQDHIHVSIRVWEIVFSI